MHEFIQNWNGPKIRIVTAGCGASLSNLLIVPGASRVIDKIYNLYSEESVLEHLRCDSLPKGTSYVSEWVSKRLCLEEAPYHLIDDIISVSVTGALTTNRYRKGNNEAYVTIGNLKRNAKTFHCQLSKLTEQEYNSFTPDLILQRRKLEDLQVSNFVLEKLTEITK